jgi:hypothetical protein
MKEARRCFVVGGGLCRVRTLSSESSSAIAVVDKTGGEADHQEIGDFLITVCSPLKSDIMSGITPMIYQGIQAYLSAAPRLERSTSGSPVQRGSETTLQLVVHEISDS